MHFQEFYVFDPKMLVLYEVPAFLGSINESMLIEAQELPVDPNVKANVLPPTVSQQPAVIQKPVAPIQQPQTIVAPLAKSTPEEIARQQAILTKPQVQEIQAATLIKNTDPGRTERGNYSIVRKKTWYKETNENLDYISFNELSKEFTQQKHQFGYVIWKDSETKPIKECYCSCPDYQFRLYFPMVKKGIAKWNVDPKFSSNTTKTVKSPDGTVTQLPFKHNQTNGKGLTNANPDKLYVCKHLFHIIKLYILGALPTENI